MGKTKPKRAISKTLGRLSARKLATAAPGLYHDGGGLYLRVADRVAVDGVTRHRARNWLYRYKAEGRQHWLGLGAASARDGDGQVTLAEARQKAADQRRLRWDGKDPIAERKAAKLAVQVEQARAMSFRSAAGRFIADNKITWKNPKHAAQWESTLETYAFPILGDIPVGELDLPIIEKVLKQDVPAAKGKPAGQLWTARPETASRLRGRIEAVLDWAAVHRYRSGENPARWKGHLDHILPARSEVQRVQHHPALAYSDVGDFMLKLRKQEGIAAEALQFTILTASRTGEVVGATPEEFDLDAAIWTIPAERMKAKRAHRVPLSDAAMAIARKYVELRRPYVFPGGKSKKPLSNMAMTAVLRRMDRGDLTVHGFRSTFRDWCAERTAFPHELAEMALAHVIGNKVEAAYRRGDMLDARRPLIDAWSKWCATPASAPANVAPIRGSASAA